MLLPATISIIAAAIVSQKIIPLAIVGWDEATFLRWIFDIYQTLVNGSLIKFLEVSRSQFSYPPLQSWVIGSLLLPFGFTIRNARLVSLIWYPSAGLLVYLLCAKIIRFRNSNNSRNNIIVPLVAMASFLSSPLMIVHAGLALKEMMGAALTLAAVYLFLLARSSKRLRDAISISLVLTLLTLTKYNYGLLIAITIFIEAVQDFISKSTRGSLFKFYVGIFAPFLIVLAVWIFYPSSRLPEFISVLSNPWLVTTGIGTNLDYLLFYPRAVIYLYSASPLLGLVMIVSFLVALVKLHQPAIRLLWIPIFLNLMFGVIHTDNLQERFIFTVIPLWFVLTAIIVSESLMLMRKLAFKIRRIVYIPLIFIMIIMIFDLTRLPKYVYAAGAYSLKFALFNQPDYRDSWFNYQTASWPLTLPKVTDEKPQDVVDFVASLINPSKPVRMVGSANEFSPPYFYLMLELAKNHTAFVVDQFSAYVFTVEVLPDSRLYTRDFKMFNEANLAGVRQIEHEAKLTLLGKKQFSNLGVITAVYGQPP